MGWLSWDDDEEEVIVDPYKYVLGMDPGGTTGLALLRYSDTTLPELVYLYQVPDGRYGFESFFRGSLLAENVDVASEQWVEREVKGSDREPIYIEGVMYALWRDNGVTYQTPDMKQLVPDQWLKDNNLWVPGKRHAMDALIHAIIWLRNNDHIPTLKNLAGEPGDKIAQPGEAQGKDISWTPTEGDDSKEDDNFIPPDFSDLADRMQELAKAAAEAAKGADGDAEQAGGGSGDDAQEGGGEVEGDGGQPGVAISDPELKGKRKRREKGGGFTGYEPKEAEEGETELYSD